MIYEIREEKWNEISCVKFKYSSSFVVCICDNDFIFNDKYVHFASNQGHAYKYDANKDKWILITYKDDDEEMLFEMARARKPKVWLSSPYILNCANAVNREEICIGFIDTRCAGEEWTTYPMYNYFQALLI